MASAQDFIQLRAALPIFACRIDAIAMTSFKSVVFPIFTRIVNLEASFAKVKSVSGSQMSAVHRQYASTLCIASSTYNSQEGCFAVNIQSSAKHE